MNETTVLREMLAVVKTGTWRPVWELLEMLIARMESVENLDVIKQAQEQSSSEAQFGHGEQQADGERKLVESWRQVPDMYPISKALNALSYQIHLMEQTLDEQSHLEQQSQLQQQEASKGSTPSPSSSRSQSGHVLPASEIVRAELILTQLAEQANAAGFKSIPYTADGLPGLWVAMTQPLTPGSTLKSPPKSGEQTAAGDRGQAPEDADETTFAP